MSGSYVVMTPKRNNFVKKTFMVNGGLSNGSLNESKST